MLFGHNLISECLASRDQVRKSTYINKRKTNTVNIKFALVICRICRETLVLLRAVSSLNPHHKQETKTFSVTEKQNQQNKTNRQKVMVGSNEIKRINIALPSGRDQNVFCHRSSVEI